MTDVTIVCDRCGETVHGKMYAKTNKVPGATVGFYYLTDGWSKYAREGEVRLCDNCMWSDEKYLADYPRATPA